MHVGERSRTQVAEALQARLVRVGDIGGSLSLVVSAPTDMSWPAQTRTNSMTARPMVVLMVPA